MKKIRIYFTISMLVDGYLNPEEAMEGIEANAAIQTLTDEHGYTLDDVRAQFEEDK